MHGIDVVIKIGGGLLAHRASLDATLHVVQAAAARQRLVVVPGGGPFADAVREVDSRVHLTDDAAHWMAILAMDQYAHLIVGRLSRGTIVSGPSELAPDVAASGIVPVLAPYQWLRQIDPLPHSWDVTSDSIAAWVSGQLGARRLILVKPPGASTRTSVDPYFTRALPPALDVDIVAADESQAFEAVLSA